MFMLGVTQRKLQTPGTAKEGRTLMLDVVHEPFVSSVAVRRRIACYTSPRVMFDLFFLCIIFSTVRMHEK